MKRKKKLARGYIAHETPADGNVFLSLGFPPDEAARLLEETDREIDSRKAVKSKSSKDAPC